MKLIHSSVELMTQPQGIEGIYKHIEAVARTCYKSQDKITEDSATGFCERLRKSSHLAMLEHGTVFLQAPCNTGDIEFWQVANSPYSVVKPDESTGMMCVTTNLRVLTERLSLHLLDKYLCAPTKHHAQRITLRFICSRAIANEFVRHRTFSFAQESTRYCNYSKEKFGKCLTFIYPSWYHFGCFHMPDEQCVFEENLMRAENDYFLLLRKGLKPQEARDVLPLALKTELVMTGFEHDWQHFFNLRLRGTTGTPHPDAEELAAKAQSLIFDAFAKSL